MWRRLEDQLKKLSLFAVEVGVFAEQDSFAAMLAAVHEYGIKIRVTPKMRAYLRSQGLALRKDTQYITIPERSFIREGLRAYMETAFQRNLENVLMRYITDPRGNPVEVYERIGAEATSAIQDAMLARKEPPLHPFTISRRRKHSDQPLVDTGKLRERVTWMTVEKTGGEG